MESITKWLIKRNKLRTEKQQGKYAPRITVNLVLPKEMNSNNPILGLCPIPNQVQVNCGDATRKYAMWWAVLFKIGKNLLL